LSETKVSIHSEVMAGIVFDSRPSVCDVSQLIKAQARNFEKAHKELASDLSKIKQDETKKIQQARRILEKKMEECDGKSRELDSRIKATAIFGDGHESVAALEHALEESHSDNRSLSFEGSGQSFGSNPQRYGQQWDNTQLAQRKGNRDKD
jgi:hypothetical protein